ncbi:hypothetical protein RDWZM_004216 [Blomia tropicalis]|uniref:p53 and DNA damage-regulated protein 1 n=1 Tax=Blomia tropicalis TaxID=40697 RepID=A0A9Q0RTQ0_BLOTA|nr:hypothetical protein RDWZM_004216 [Blomia tropicalis]
MEQEEVYNVIDLLRKSEVLGEKVLRDRDEVVQMDRIRNKNREALNALKNKAEDDSVYLCTGNMFFKHRIKTARKLIQDDQTNVNDHIETLRRQIKNNVQKLQEIEDKGEEFSKFNLNPLSQSEMNSFNTVLKSIHKMKL